MFPEKQEAANNHIIWPAKYRRTLLGFFQDIKAHFHVTLWEMTTAWSAITGKSFSVTEVLYTFYPALWNYNHRIIDSFRLESTLRIIKSNHQPNTATKLCPYAPHPHSSPCRAPFPSSACERCKLRTLKGLQLHTTPHFVWTMRACSSFCESWISHMSNIRISFAVTLWYRC